MISATNRFPTMIRTSPVSATTLTLKAIILGLAMVTVNGASQAAPGNLCPNPGFELLNPAGDNFPLQWGPSRSETGKSQVTIAKDAYQGAIAVRMSSQEAESATMNSELIKARAGTFSFHYMATRFSPAASFLTDLCAASYLRLSEVEAINEAGDNVALASKGAEVSKSFTGLVDGLLVPDYPIVVRIR